MILNLISDTDYYDDPSKALERSMVKTNQQMHASRVDDTLSGTTAVGVILKVGGQGIEVRGRSWLKVLGHKGIASMGLEAQCLTSIS